MRPIRSGLILILAVTHTVSLSAGERYRSPSSLAMAPDGKLLYVSDSTAGNVTILDLSNNRKRSETALRGTPRGVALSADGARLYVAEHGAGTVAVVDTVTNIVSGRVTVGKWPTAVALAHNGHRLYVCNQDNHTVSVIDLEPSRFGQAIQHIPVVREPVAAAVTPDDRYVVVANLLPHGVATDPELAAEVSLIDTTKLVQTARVKLPAGSTMVHGICVSPDSRWAYVVHGLGRFNLPITQLDRGWVNTYALSVIDIVQSDRLVTVLLDQVTQGAADPHSIACSRDGRRLWISHAGVHEVSIIDIGLVHELLDGEISVELASIKEGSEPNIWVRIRKDRQQKSELEHHLSALYMADAIRRVPSGGQGPRGLVLSPDGKRLCVANYFSGTVSVLDADDGKIQGSISLGTQPEPDAARRGQFIFHNANHAFQRWHSCASCHANEGRVDGLRWDFPQDGIGNGKDTISLVNLHHTEPMTRRGLFASSHEQTRGGLESTNGLAASDQDVDDLYAYLTSLKPTPSPFLTRDGKLTEAAQRGRLLFDGKAACKRCHGGPYFTDNKLHNVGVLSDHYKETDGRYDTPSLIETYRTAPYLHDGRAVTVMDVLTIHDKSRRHGKTTALTDQELKDLVEYVLSL